MKDKSLKFLKNKQKAYFKEHKVNATDDILISSWMEEYHEECVLENALTDSVLDVADEDVMLRKLWLNTIAKATKSALIKHKNSDTYNINSFEITNLANDIVTAYRMTFIDYVAPPPIYYPPPPQAYSGDDAPIDANAFGNLMDDAYQ